MKFTTPLAAIALLSPTVLAGPKQLPACSTNSQLPCRCPAGTDYSESVTWSVIGAAASDVKALMSDFYKCGWLGVTPFKTHGPDNYPGVSIRTSHFPVGKDVYDVSELLTTLRTDSRGGFIQKFEQLESTIPMPYKSGNGSFSGYWVSLETNSIFKYTTAVTWSVFACETGHARNFAKFHEFVLNNVTSTLQAQGKILGQNVAPFSVQSF